MTQRKSAANSAIGRQVIARESTPRLDITPGMTGEIVGLERHTANPWIRYTVEFADGVTSPGLIAGQDIKIV